MLLGFGQIVHDAFALQMRGQSAAATRLRSAPLSADAGGSFVVGAVSASFDRSSTFTP
jgi:hypothetical protein